MIVTFSFSTNLAVNVVATYAPFDFAFASITSFVNSAISDTFFSPTYQPANSYPAFALAVEPIGIPISGFITSLVDETFPFASASYVIVTFSFSINLAVNVVATYAPFDFAFVSITSFGNSATSDTLFSPTYQPANSYPAFAVAVEPFGSPISGFIVSLTRFTIPFASASYVIVTLSNSLKFAI